MGMNREKILGCELWEKHFDSVLCLVKDYIVNILEVWKIYF